MLGRDLKDVIGGLIFVAIGLAFFLGAFNYRIETARNMGPGYVPMALGGLTIVIGLSIVILARRRPIAYPPISWRPLFAVLAGIAAFGLTMERLGLVPAVLAAGFIAALGDRTMSWSHRIALSLAIAAGAWVIFSLALGLPMPAFRRVW